MPPRAEIIVTQDRLVEACDLWRGAGVFAFDTEFIRDETYDAALCLVQVACGDVVTLIDPTADVDISVFWSLVHDPGILKVVHAGKEDFDVCTRSTGKPPRNIFDVQIAAGFVGLGYPLSLTRLAAVVAHKRVSKGQTLSDWLRRPLTDEQLQYAVDDVAHLPQIHRTLGEKLAAANRQTWAAEEFALFENVLFYKPPASDRLFKLKGIKSLDGLSLLILERLIAWRDDWAREKNRPTRAMMRDDILVEIARRRPTQAQQLEVMRGFPQAKSVRVISGILEIIERARSVPKSEWPRVEPQRDESPMTRVVIDILSAFTRSICHREQLDIDLLGSTQRLRDLLDYFQGLTTQKPALLEGWRGEFIGRRLTDLLEGRCELHLSGWPADPQLDVITHKSPKPKSARPHNPARSAAD